MHSKYFLPGERRNGVVSAQTITPESAGWSCSGLRVVNLAAGESISITTNEDEYVLVPLAGSFTVRAADHHIRLAGRPSVFDGPTDFVYVGRDDTVEIGSEQGGRIALGAARARSRHPVRYVPATDVAVELRGAGSCSRQVHNFATADTFDADSIIACEVITPAGNWSSYPAHKHDEDTPDESALEEIYYFEFDPSAHPDRDLDAGFGFHRVYGTPDRPIDVLEEVRTGDIVLVPHGFHGPSVAAPGYHMYYLNIMAGTGAERAWRICDDPAHTWLRDTWADQPVDPRLPLRRSVTAEGDRS